ncbi:hypothetical protein ACWFNE_03210 [Cellulomonas sp. NPDC055163]
MAREYLQVARERLELAPNGTSDVAQVAAANAVQAAIAAADALCGRAHGFRSAGQDHREAVSLVKSLPEIGPRLAPKLSRLASDKTELTYGGWCTRAVAERAVKDAGVFVDELDRLSL